MCEYDTSTTVRQWLYTAPKFLCLMTSILLFLLFITLSTRDPLFYNEQTVILSNVFANFRQAPINNIALATDSECPSEYEKVTLGIWAGTNTGCALTGGVIQNGSCPRQSSSSFEEIPSIGPQNLDLWNNNEFCVQRTTSLYYTPNITECTKSCSPNTCVSSEESCPITHIKVIQSDEPLPDYHQELVINEGTKLIYSNNITAYDSGEFITDLRATLFGEPCFDPFKNPVPENEDVYPLLIASKTGCGDFGSVNHLNILETLPASEVLKQNGVDDSELAQLPSFNEYLQKNKAYFSALKRYTVKDAPKCTTIGSDIFHRLRIYETNFMDSLWSITIVLMIVMVALVVTLPIETLLRQRNKDEEKLMLRLIAYLNIGFLSFLFFLYIVKGIIALDAQSDLNPEVLYLKNILNNECFNQPEVNEVLEKLIHQISSDIYVILALNITLLCLALIGLILISVLTGVDISQVRRFKETQTSSGLRSRRKKNNQHQNHRNNGNTEMLLRNAH